MQKGNGITRDNLPKIIWINKHAGICCGFTIRVLPRRVGKKRYQIMKDDDSLELTSLYRKHAER
jgi:hypothetical protein